MRPFYLILISVSLGVIGQLCLKQGMRGFGGNFSELFLYALRSPFVISGFGFYALSSLIWLIVLSRVNLSYAYPMLSIGYVLIVFFSWLIFKENIGLWHWAGVILICLGVSLLSR